MTQISGSNRRRRILFTTAAVLAVLGAGAGYYSMPDAGRVSAAVAAPSVPVDVETVAPQSVRIWSTFSGRMHAVDSAEIRPEVSGRIIDVRFREGQVVKAGDILFVIDPRSYEAAMAKAEANLASAKTNADFARIDLDRATNLVKSQAIAQRLFDERANANHVTQAAISVAAAELRQAQIDLDHAYVKAPFSGRIGRPEITAGNFVQAGASAPVLTSIVSNDGIYADFNVDEQTYMEGIRAYARTQDTERQIPVRLTVQGDEEHPYTGTIYSFDNQIDTASGTIRARARFDNEDGGLVPGMFVSVELASGSKNAALLVSDRAIGNDQDKKFVYVVGNDNKVAYREVTLGQQIGSQRIVQSGLRAGDRVIVDGVQHVRPDVTVQVKEASLSDQTRQLAANTH